MKRLIVTIILLAAPLAVFAQANGVVGEHMHYALLHERGHANRIA